LDPKVNFLNLPRDAKDEYMKYKIAVIILFMLLTLFSYYAISQGLGVGTNVSATVSISVSTIPATTILPTSTIPTVSIATIASTSIPSVPTTSELVTVPSTSIMTTILQNTAIGAGTSFINVSANNIGSESYANVVASDNSWLGCVGGLFGCNNSSHSDTVANVNLSTCISSVCTLNEVNSNIVVENSISLHNISTSSNVIASTNGIGGGSINGNALGQNVIVSQNTSISQNGLSSNTQIGVNTPTSSQNGTCGLIGCYLLADIKWNYGFNSLNPTVNVIATTNSGRKLIIVARLNGTNYSAGARISNEDALIIHNAVSNALISANVDINNTELLSIENKIVSDIISGNAHSDQQSLPVINNAIDNSINNVAIQILQNDIPFIDNSIANSIINSYVSAGSTVSLDNAINNGIVESNIILSNTEISFLDNVIANQIITANVQVGSNSMIMIDSSVANGVIDMTVDSSANQISGLENTIINQIENSDVPIAGNELLIIDNSIAKDVIGLDNSFLISNLGTIENTLANSVLNANIALGRNETLLIEGSVANGIITINAPIPLNEIPIIQNTIVNDLINSDISIALNGSSLTNQSIGVLPPNGLGANASCDTWYNCNLIVNWTLVSNITAPNPSSIDNTSIFIISNTGLSNTPFVHEAVFNGIIQNSLDVASGIGSNSNVIFDFVNDITPAGFILINSTVNAVEQGSSNTFISFEAASPLVSLGTPNTSSLISGASGIVSSGGDAPQKSDQLYESLVFNNDSSVQVHDMHIIHAISGVRNDQYVVRYIPSNITIFSNGSKFVVGITNLASGVDNFVNTGALKQEFKNISIVVSRNFTGSDIAVIGRSPSNVTDCPDVACMKARLSEGKVPIMGPYNTYSYVYVNATLNDSYIIRVNYSFNVSKSWVQSSNVSKDKVTLYRFNDTSDAWERLPTTLVGENTTNYFYTAVSPGFSLYAIGTDAPEQQPIANTVGSTSNPPYYLYAALLIIVLALILGYFSLLSKRKNKVKSHNKRN
jgi:hypothetical protein